MKEKLYVNIKSPNLFKNKYLELLTRSNPVLIFIIFIGISVYLAFTAINEYDFGASKLVGLFIGGFVSWTFAEYLIHRFLYHDSEGKSSKYRFKYVLHGVHHMYPNDRSRIIISPIPALMFASFLVLLFYIILGDLSFMFISGFFTGYACFMSIHYIVHVTPTPKRFNFWWKYHMIHHYQQPNRAFGVTTSFWDRVFKTLPEGIWIAPGNSAH